MSERDVSPEGFPELPVDRLRQIVDTVPVGIVLADTDGVLTFANPAAGHVLGLEVSAIRERTFDDPTWTICSADGGDFPLEELPLAIVLRTRRPVTQVVHGLRQPDGSITVISVDAAPLTDDGGGFVGMAASITDVTEATRLRRDIDGHSAQLARSNAELEEFASVASHDLQEPLRMVHSFLQLLERRLGDDLDDESRQYIAFATDGAARMQTLIQDLLSWSRVSTRGQHFGRCSMEDVLSTVRRDLQMAVEESGAVIEHGQLPTVFADEAQMVQLLTNLIANAVKFRYPDRPPRITVDAEHEGDRWRFRVRDNGIGIPAHQSERIFKVFTRLHSMEEYPGTGIGLAVCRRIVERHDGELVAVPGEGGATFEFTVADTPEADGGAS